MASCCKGQENRTDKIIDFKNQTRLVGSRIDGARISSMNPTDQTLTYHYPDAQTLYEIFLKGKEISSIVIFKCIILKIQSFRFNNLIRSN